MGFPAIELDHLSSAAPMAVDFKSLLIDRDPVIEARSRQSVTPQERQEPFLQPAPGASGRKPFDTGQRRPHPPHPAPTRVALDQIKKRQAVVESQVFGLANQVLDLIYRRDRGKIEDRPWHGGDRNPVKPRHLVDGQVRTMSVDTRGGPPFPWRRHMNRPWACLSHGPKRSRRLVTENRLPAGRKDPCQPSCLPWQRRMPHGVDTRMQSM